ncbi:MAG TPA: polysaccharide deacetylase family protein [bacterium]|nr:polysaccharide deacetylase family protein [Myxococcales bacterium]OQA58820.1 MAG: Peptidoglycan-N-acetylmuramic acid deacetylase PdaA precursor [bacterium ADurb.Bin270]HPW45423.1 polysaccharide deacetylase family protein [bacterium]HQC51374.1 polysaccharide deacetylase family protein [bacterium]HQH80996.1 polysaccharide deacetylase family protein [bacterium]
MNVFFASLAIYFIAACLAAYIFIPQLDWWLVKKRWKHRKNKIAALSFDDGPSEEWTPAILDILKREKVSATFFLVGEKVRENPELAKRIRAEGHEIGNHTFDHRKISFNSGRKIALNLVSTSNEIAGAAGDMPRLVRTPHGFRRPFINKTAKRLGMQLVPWTKGIFDTDGAGPDLLLKRFSKKFQRLEILLLHDGIAQASANESRSSTVQVLPKIIEKYKKSEYEFRLIGDL